MISIVPSSGLVTVKNLAKQSLVICVFLFITLIFFRHVLLSPGTIIGYDWGLPTTFIQIDKSFQDSLLTWADQGNYLGNRNTFMAATPFIVFIKSLTFIGVDGQTYIKILLLLLFTLAGFSMYQLARFFHIGEINSIMAGSMYITAPIFFDYSIMGWIFVLIALALLPIAVKYFIKAVAERKIYLALITGIMYSVSIIQAQSLIWFMMVFGAFGLCLIKDRASFVSYIRTLFVIILIFFLINAYWILGLVFVPDKTTFDTGIVRSTVSMGTMGHYYPVNIIRLWGGLVNYQYENAINSSPILMFLSYLVPVLALSAFCIKEKKRIIITLWIIGLIPLLIFYLNNYRDILLYIPFSGGIRDFARFTILTTFAYPLLAAFTLDAIRKRLNGTIFFLIIVMWILSISPWWSGEISNWHGGSGCNGRFRTKIFPEEYHVLEQDLSKKRLDHKSFYIPTGGIVYFNDDSRFFWICNSIWDIFSSFSPIPGALGLSDRGHGYLTHYVETIRVNLEDDLLNVLIPSNIKYIIARKNLLVDENRFTARVVERGIKNGLLTKIADNSKIIIYGVNNFLPHFYTPSVIHKTNISVEKLPQINASGDTKRRAIFFEFQNKNKTLDQSSFENLPILEYKKESPVKYRIRIHGAKETFPLVFLESFHDEWKAYPAKMNVGAGLKPIDPEKIHSGYRIMEKNEDEQATIEELTDYVDKGWISYLGNNDTINFVSKNYSDTIQNDNLKTGVFYETWMKTPLAEKYHLMMNGYSNGWIVDAQALCAQAHVCSQNPDGSYNFELIIEFKLQKYFYIGSFISLAAIIVSALYVVFQRR